MRFIIDDYDKWTVMHCKTKEEALDFCDYLDSLGYRWCNGIRYTTKTMWRNGDECYRFKEGTHSSLQYFIGQGYTVLEYSDFDWSNCIKSNISYDEVIF